MSSSSFDEGIEAEIPALFFMFSGADDSQQACGVDNVATFTLPDPAGKSGGACTTALLQVLYNDEEDVQVDLSWVETLNAMHEKIQEIGLPQVPQLSSSRMIDLEETMQIVPDGYEGTKRALLIGINYTGEANALTSCHNDVRNIKDFLMKVHGFQRDEMLILMDDGKHHEPTKKMIMDGFRRLTEISEPGDVVFVQFSGTYSTSRLSHTSYIIPFILYCIGGWKSAGASQKIQIHYTSHAVSLHLTLSFTGHGGQIVDVSGDEDDGFDEILIPGDYKESGQIVDDEIYEEFVTKMGPGVAVTALIDCCHSGTAMDLPYICSAGDTEIQRDAGFKIPQSGVDLPAPKKKKDKEKKPKGEKKKKVKEDKEETALALVSPKKKKVKEDKEETSLALVSPKKKKVKEDKEETSLALVSPKTSKKKKVKDEKSPKPEKKKKKKKEQEPEPEPEPEEEEDEEDAVMVEEVHSEEEVEEPEPVKAPPKKKGLFGFGRKKK